MRFFADYFVYAPRWIFLYDKNKAFKQPWRLWREEKEKRIKEERGENIIGVGRISLIFFVLVDFLAFFLNLCTQTMKRI